MMYTRVSILIMIVVILQVIRSRGQGYPIIVSSNPKDTSALFSLQDPSEVLTFLSRLARWKNLGLGSRRKKRKLGFLCINYGKEGSIYVDK